jgi:hypothetical protein
MLLALRDLLTAASDTDPVFERLYAFLMAPLIGGIAHHFIFPCLASLCINSRRAVRRHFPHLFPLLISVLDQDTSLTEDAIHAAAQLSVTCRDQFSPHAAAFVGFLLPLLHSSDARLQNAGLQATYLVLTAHAAHLSGVLPSLVPLLLELSERAPDTDPDDDDNDNADDDDDEDADADRLTPASFPAVALKILAAASQRWPALLAAHGPAIVAAVDRQLASPHSDAAQLACHAAEHLCRMAAAPAEVAVGLVARAAALIGRTRDAGTAGECFAVLEAAVEAHGAAVIGGGLAPALDAVRAALRGRLPCQGGARAFVGRLHGPMSNMVRQLIESLGPRAFAQCAPIVPPIVGLATHRSRQWRELALDTLAQFVSAAARELPPELVRDVLCFAVAGLRDNSRSAAAAIAVFADAAPDVLAPHVAEVLDVLLAKVAAPRRRASVGPEFVDNAVAAIAAIQKCIVKDAFPVEQFLMPCLEAMPAVEDTSVNPEIFAFYLWLAQRSGIEPPEAFAIPAVRLLSMEADELSEMALLIPEIARVMGVALQKLENAEKLVFEVCEGDLSRVERISSAIAVN